MLKAQFRDGETLTFDLRRDQRDIQRALRREDVTSVSIHWNGTNYVLPKPRGTGNCRWAAELIQLPDGSCVGERLICQLFMIQASVTVYYSSHTVRYDLADLRGKDGPLHNTSRSPGSDKLG